MDSALVTDGNAVAALAVVRSLGRKGINVIVAEDSNSMSFYSKYAKGHFIYPSPARHKREFQDFILKKIKENRYDLFLPISDSVIMSLMGDFDTLSKYTHIPMPDSQTIDKTLDKSKTLKIAAGLGIPIPKTYFIEDTSDVKRVSGEINYPCVIKPIRSRFYVGSEIVPTCRIFVNSPRELIEKYQIQHEKFPFPLIQDRVSGRGIGIFLLFNKGKLRAVFSHKRLREIPASGGASTLCESITPDPALEKQSIKILEAIKWHGAAMVEFKEDERDGVPKLMEINGRLWGSLPLAIRSGVDFPHLLYKMAKDGDIDPVLNYRLGIKCRWLRGDLMRLLEILFKTEQKKGRKSGIAYPGKWSSIMEFLKFWERDMYYYNESIDDPMPSLVEFKELFHFLLLRAFKPCRG